VIGYQGEIAFDVSKPEGPLKKTLDTQRLQQVLGWTPPTSLEAGIAATLEWLEIHHATALSDESDPR
jgi:GDP-L-fucose synthase